MKKRTYIPRKLKKPYADFPEHMESIEETLGFINGAIHDLVDIIDTAVDIMAKRELRS